MIRQVFVYGTLLSGCANHQLIHPWVLGVQKATVEGVLYSLPYGYPAVVRGRGRVCGELVTFSSFEAALISMDRLEGYKGPGADNFYERISVLATLTDGSVHECFMYVFPPEQTAWLEKNAILIEGGDWLEFRRN